MSKSSVLPAASRDSFWIHGKGRKAFFENSTSCVTGSKETTLVYGLELTVFRINPVKIVLHVFPSLSRWHIAGICSILIGYLFLSELKELIYYSIKIFFHSIISIFFREVEVIGLENVPKYGPVIFTINHANQFMDAVMVMSTCQVKVSFLMAEASWKRRIIGDIAWALGVVPVKRAQDDAKRGTGTITVKKNTDDGHYTLKGNGTKFMKELGPKDKIRPPGTAVALKVIEVKDDETAILDGTDIPSSFEAPDTNEVNFDVLKHVDTKKVFEKVLERLAAGGAVGIFPEGGSTDKTSLLPLKVGISLIAYSALEKDNLNVPIVPVGLNYFRAHRWRGRVTVEYGRPIMIDPNTLDAYKAGGQSKRDACNELLEQVENAMKSVIVATSDWETLQLIHTARRLYQRKKGPLEASEKQDLSRRFAEGYRRLLLMTNGNPPKEWLELQSRIKEYSSDLKDLGLKDYQVLALQGEHLDDTDVDPDKFLSFLQIPYQIVHLCFLLTLAAFPMIFLNLPIGLLAGLYAEKRRKKALAKSKVKVKGFDVMLTEKVVFCIVMVPTLWIFYGILLSVFTDLDRPTIGLAFVSMPLFAYMGIIVAEAGMVDYNSLRPYFIRLVPSARRRLAALPQRRKDLQDDLRAFVRKIGPGLGDLYHKKEINWNEILDKAQNAENKKLE